MHKYFGYGDFFCWNCGKRLHTGRKRCPHCGAWYNSVNKPVTKRVTTHTFMGPLHPTVIWYLITYVLACLVFAIGWCCIMYFFMDVTFVDERKYVYVILWGFWIIWLVCWVIGKFTGVVKIRAKNDLPGNFVSCAMCGTQVARSMNYCPRCGTVIFATHTGVVTEEEAKSSLKQSKKEKKKTKD